jgi:hypothetical protein
MVDVERMESRPVSKILKVEGFTCGTCGGWNPVFYVTTSLQEQMRKLEHTPATHRNFAYYFSKTLRKAAGVQERSNNGAF